MLMKWVISCVDFVQFENKKKPSFVFLYYVSQVCIWANQLIHSRAVCSYCVWMHSK